MNKIAIIFHSGFGHTEKVAQEVARGARSVEGVSVDLMTAGEAIENIHALDDRKTLVFGSPTYMGGPSAQFKAFADATSEKWMKGVFRNKLAAGFTNSGGLAGDKLATLQYFSILAAQHGMLWISLGQDAPLTKSGHGATPDMINRFDSSLGLMTQSDNASVEKTPAPGDLKSAFLFGQRIAHVTQLWAGAK